MLLKDFISGSTESLLHLYPQAEARSIVLMLCEELLGTRSYTHIVEPKTEVDPAMMPVLEQSMKRLCDAEPVQYVLGHAEFAGRRFRVTRDVLIPRPETEQLVQEAIKVAGRIARSRGAYGKSADQVRILDMCTGSGCIAWSMAFGVPGAQVVAVDVSDEALAVASGQDFAQELRGSEVIPPVFVHADVLQDPDASQLGSFDIIISNPPYVLESQRQQMRPNVLQYEPGLALFVPDHDPLLFYRAVAHWAGQLLRPRGVGMVEINDLLGRETEAVFREAGFPDTSTVKDFSDKNRIVTFAR